jgi:hypothetical protein
MEGTIWRARSASCRGYTFYVVYVFVFTQNLRRWVSARMAEAHRGRIRWRARVRKLMMYMGDVDLGIARGPVDRFWGPVDSDPTSYCGVVG